MRDSFSKIILTGEKTVTIEPLTAEQCEKLEFTELENDPENGRNLYLEYALEIGGKTMCNDSALFTKPKHFEFKDPKIEYQIRQKEDEFVIVLTSRAFAKYVEVSFEEVDIILDDNYIHLSAGEPRRLTLNKTQMPEGLSSDMLAKQISIRSLYDIEEHAK